MKPIEEVIKTLEMLKSAGFEPVDAIFKGMVAVMNKSTLQLIQDLADKGEAIGTLTIIYKTPDGELRTIEIPIGAPTEAGQQAPQAPSQQTQ
ncbi:MAG: hypothetical protein GXO00_00490 [Candidatus Diapherotrites archaeon]|nr:hypothetical protein [Candidatus Diapherotrites archaeon]